MDILAIDIGTKTGYAYNRGDKLECGTWVLASAKEVTAWGKARLTRRKDPRIERLGRLVSDLGHFDVIIFEDVNFVSTTYQAHLWAGLRSALWLCGRASVFECVSVATLKKYTTGTGAATKELMAKFLLQNPKFANLPKLDDNGVDAVCLWAWAQENLSRLRIIFR